MSSKTAEISWKQTNSKDFFLYFLLALKEESYIERDFFWTLPIASLELFFLKDFFFFSKLKKIIFSSNLFSFQLKIISNDDDLRSIENQKIKLELLDKYNSMLEFIDIG